MNDNIAQAPSQTNKNREGAAVHPRGFLFRLVRDMAALPRAEALLLACVMLGGLWGVLAAIGIVNSPPAR